MKIKYIRNWKIIHYIENSGRKKKDIAEAIGIKPYTLYDRISGRTQWRYEELKLLATILNFGLCEIIEVEGEVGAYV